MKNFTTVTIEKETLKNIHKIKGRLFPDMNISNNDMIKKLIIESEELNALKQRNQIYDLEKM